jgi:predicted nucleic acid-binding protein
LFVSEISIEESRRHLKFLKCTKRDLSVLLAKYVDEVLVAPTLKEIRDCKNIFSDEEDLYLIATSRKIDAHYLVSLDKKHVLSQAKKIKRPKILSPGEFIKILDR